jgi:hypothetical protein
MKYWRQAIMPNDTRRQERLDFAHQLRTRHQLFHPSIAPFLISLAIYFAFFTIGSIFRIHYSEWVQDILFLTISFSIGISGLIILRRREFVGKFGHIARGAYACSVGIVFIVFGFGITLLGLYSLFIK